MFVSVRTFDLPLEIDQVWRELVQFSAGDVFERVEVGIPDFFRGGGYRFLGVFFHVELFGAGAGLFGRWDWVGFIELLLDP